jgi:hypothetical protein
MQAVTIMGAMIEPRQTEDLADAFMEAYDRGQAWKEGVRKSLDQIEGGFPETCHICVG